jgi:transcriptional regulator with XRE-family HTH domain
MAIDVFDVREIVTQVCVRTDVLDACRRRDLGTVITILGTQGVTQGRISELTGISQGRLSEYKTGKRTPRASTTFEAFADGVGMPPTAREALGLVPGHPAVTAAGRRVVGEGRTDVGLRSPGDPAEAAANLASSGALISMTTDPCGQAVDPAAWGDASLAWLVSPERLLTTDTRTNVRIGSPDVARFRTTVDAFARLDDRFGGGHALSVRLP